MYHTRYLKVILFLFLSLNSLNCFTIEQDKNKILHSNKAFTVQLDKKIINETGIETQKLLSTTLSPEIETFATRVDLSSLIDARKDYFTALAKRLTANIKYQQSQQDLQRLENLQREKAVSTRKLIAQKSQLKIDKANFLATAQQVDIIRLHTQSKWGEILSHWFLGEQSPYANMMNTLNKSLYLVYLPVSIPSPTAVISIHPTGIREKAQTASLISSAVMHNLQQTGTPFFYLSDQALDTYHHRVVAWLPLQEEKKTGFIVPESAIVWHLSQSYLYLQVDDELFKRVKILRKKLISSKSYFIQQPLREGNTLVTSGAQMLLAEEFRGTIPAEDDDDDDDDDDD